MVVRRNWIARLRSHWLSRLARPFTRWQLWGNSSVGEGGLSTCLRGVGPLELVAYGGSFSLFRVANFSGLLGGNRSTATSQKSECLKISVLPKSRSKVIRHLRSVRRASITRSSGAEQRLCSGTVVTSCPALRSRSAQLSPRFSSGFSLTG